MLLSVSVAFLCRKSLQPLLRSPVRSYHSSGCKMASPAPNTGEGWNPNLYVQHASFVPKLGEVLLDLLNPQSGERILDLGCGDGALTVKLVEAGCQVKAVDSSPEQVEYARQRGLDAEVMCAQNLTATEPYDAVFTNAVLHWVPDHDAVARGVWSVLRPGGRFVGEFGANGNIASIRTAIHRALKKRGVDPVPRDPWLFPTEEEFRGRLEKQGFRVAYIQTIPRPTPLCTNVEGWLQTFAMSFTKDMTAEEKAAVLREVQEEVRGQLYDDVTGAWTADYVRLRFAAVKPMDK
eukprot:comp21282_c0_seq1/m.29049 comp21282_c0_seq1/g.29049  ORF comp21282_c0_seq1/g.29049 comp21282_c0_seq1/m.29049 type:complete len:292 (-) comp21282_c0_seq1:139-1014(-)